LESGYSSNLKGIECGSFNGNIFPIKVANNGVINRFSKVFNLE